jgi:hypothetical protein
MPGVGFEATIPVFERTKTFHGSDSAATVIGVHIRAVIEHTAVQSGQTTGKTYSYNTPRKQEHGITPAYIYTF